MMTECHLYVKYAFFHAAEYILALIMISLSCNHPVTLSLPLFEYQIKS